MCFQNFNTILGGFTTADSRYFPNMLFLVEYKETNDLVDSAMGFWTVPNLGKILAPNIPTNQLILNMIFEDEGPLTECLSADLSCHYLDARQPGMFQDE
ncbi:hypothetical protein VP01_453g16 [Puccinia sorghi]|uniref:Uncharacterized protein n=1 Tax=Puccinia sorghi TaxID=27349 RepID=A0A0L6UNW9_9BASI|nr:hypothetical protein VP01_453g16 [Puccinia sorghi]